jgi:hypothetical protein
MSDGNTTESVDTTSVVDNAARDASALVASLYKGDVESYSLLIQFYQDDTKAQAALCGSLAAFASACLTTIDNVRDHVLVSDGVMIPSGENVLKSVMVRLAVPSVDPAE